MDNITVAGRATCMAHPAGLAGTAACLLSRTSPVALVRVSTRTGRLLALAACALFVACGSSASPPPATESGVPAAAAASWGFFEYTRDFLSDLRNARWGRITGILWAEIERPPGSGTYDWRQLDSRVANAQMAGMNGVLVLKTGNGSSFSEPDCFRRVDAGAAVGAFPDGRAFCSCPITAEMESSWSRMVTAVVERYDGDGDRDMPGLTGSIRLDVQVENEAANWQYWDYGETDRTLAADRYLRLLDLSYRAKQAADPDTQVILAGLFQPNLLAHCDADPRCTTGIRQHVVFTERILGRPETFDAVDAHFFVYYHFEPQAIDEGFQWVADQMQRRGYERPVYCLEWTGSSLLHVTEGYGDAFIEYFPYRADFANVDAFLATYAALDEPGNLTYRRWFEAEQAKEFGKLFTNMLALGASRLVHVQYSDYREGAAWSNHWWNWQGIIKYVGGTPIRKPAYYTYNILSERISGFTAARRIEQGGKIRLYEFTFPTRQPIWVLWTDGAPAVLDLSPVIARATLRVTHLVTELDGANEPVVQREGTVPVAAVPAGDVPVLLEGLN